MSKHKICFDPDYELLPIPDDVVTEPIDWEAEKSVIRSDRDHYRQNTGPVARAVGEAMMDLMPTPGEKEFLTADVRLHQLSEGEYPAISVWHTDAFPRRRDKPVKPGDKPTPDFDRLQRIPNRSALAILADPPGALLSNPVFVASPLTIEYEPGEEHWERYHDFIEEKFASGEVESFQLTDRQICTFNHLTLHCTRPAAASGWRMMIRVGVSRMPPLNIDYGDEYVLKEPGKAYRAQ